MLDLRIVGLPQPTILSRTMERGGRWYVRYFAPSAVVVALAMALFKVWRRRPSFVVSDVSTKDALLRRVSLLEEQRTVMSERQYQTTRAAIKRALIDSEVRRQFPD